MSVSQGTWNTGEQIRDHKLACSIINFHGTEDAVFDEASLDELKRFTLSRSVTTRDQMVQDEGWTDAPGSNRAQSLTGYLIVRYGTDNEALDERDWELLDQWFHKGMPVGEHVQR